MKIGGASLASRRTWGGESGKEKKPRKVSSSADIGRSKGCQKCSSKVLSRLGEDEKKEVENLRERRSRKRKRKGCC